jgi:hypothetical protein
VSESAAVKIDGVRGEVVLKGGRQAALASGETEGAVEASEGEVRVIWAVFRRKAAASHAVGDLLLKIKKARSGFDFGHKGAGAGEGVEVGESDGEWRGGEVVQFKLDGD